MPTYIYHLGDYDPSGVNAGEKIESTLRELAPDVEIDFERIAVTPEQIKDRLLSRDLYYPASPINWIGRDPAVSANRFRAAIQLRGDELWCMCIPERLGVLLRN